MKRIASSFTFCRVSNIVRSALLLLMAFLIVPAFAQSGTVRGLATDASSGDPLVGANVLINNTGIGASTDQDGAYVMNNVPAGTYIITIAYVGYQEATQEISVAAGETTEANFDLAEATLPGQEIVVSASRKLEKVTEAPSTISVIGAKTVDQYASPNIAELLARQKGVDYVRGGVVGAGINVRGFNSAFNSKNLQMTDSRLSSLIATGLPLGPLNTVVKEDVERMEVILGPAGALYGPNAHNGLVNTITKDPRLFPGMTAVVGGGNQSLVTGRFRVADAPNEKFAFKVTGEYTQAEEFEYVDSVYIGGVAFDELELDRDVNTTRGEAAFYYTPKPGHDIVISGGGSNNNYLSQTNAGRNQIRDWKIFYGQAQYVSPHFYAQFYHTWSKTDSTYAINQRTQNYQSLLAGGYSDSEARELSFTQQWVPLSDTTSILVPRGAIFVDDSRRMNAEMQYNNSVNGFEYAVGGQWQRDLADSKNTYLLDQDGAISIDQFGGYVQLEKALGSSGFKAVLAARADDHELYGFNFIPKAALVYSTPVGSWRVTYGKGIAAPSILNLNGNLFGGLLLGNGEGFTTVDSNGVSSTVEALEAETIQTFELGFKGVVNPRFYVDANAYYNISENFVSPLINIAPPGGTVSHRGDQLLSDILPGLTPAGSGLVLTYLNFGKVNTYGADLGLNFFVNDNVSLFANFSYFDFSLDEDDEANDGNRDGKVDVNDLPINTPRLKASLGANFQRQQFYGSLFLRWVEEYDFFSGINVAAATNEDLIYGGSPVVEGQRVGRDFNEGPLGGVVNIDVNLGYRITNYLSLGASVTNLFDAEVRDFVAAPPIGRLVAAELKFSR